MSLPQKNIYAVENAELKDAELKDFGCASLLGNFLAEYEHDVVEEIIYGLIRGEIAALNAPPDVGKSTLALNLLLALACGEAFAPLCRKGQPRKVIYYDFEAEPNRVRHDLGKMMQSLSVTQRKMVEENMAIRFGATPKYEPLCLSEKSCMEDIELDLTETFRGRGNADLIVIDTLAASIELLDENSNAEINRKLLRPLSILARRTKTAVLILDHMGKSRDAGLFAGRGASAKAAAARLVLNLEADRQAEGCITLKCVKIKGQKFNDTTLRLDQETRWFRMTDEPALKGSTHTQKVISVVLEAGTVMKRADIFAALNNEMSEATAERALKEAVELGQLRQYGRGLYEASNIEGQAK